LEKPFQVDATDGRGGSLKASAHLDLFAHPLHPVRRNVEGLRLAIQQEGDLILPVQAFAGGAITGGPATGPLAFDKRAGQHFAEQTEAADEFAAQFQVGIVGCFPVTLTKVSKIREIKYPRRFARMTQTAAGTKTLADKRTSLGPYPYLAKSLTTLDARVRRARGQVPTGQIVSANMVL
jgi:hypothetical protein